MTDDPSKARDPLIAVEIPRTAEMAIFAATFPTDIYLLGAAYYALEELGEWGDDEASNDDKRSALKRALGKSWRRILQALDWPSSSVPYSEQKEAIRSAASEPSKTDGMLAADAELANELEAAGFDQVEDFRASRRAALKDFEEGKEDEANLWTFWLSVDPIGIGAIKGQCLLAKALWPSIRRERKSIAGRSKKPSSTARLFPAPVEQAPVTYSRNVAGSKRGAEASRRKGSVGVLSKFENAKQGGGLPGLKALSLTLPAGQVSIPWDPETGGLYAALETLNAQLGIRATRDVLVTLFQAWTSRARLGEPFWIFATEHATHSGLDGKNAATQVVERFGQLNSTRLRAEYTDGTVIDSPVVAVLETASGRGGLACRVVLNTAIHRGIAEADGKLGRYWVPYPTKLLSTAANPQLDAAAFAIGQAIRAQRGRKKRPEITQKMSSVWESLGIATRPDRNKQTQAGSQTKGVYEALAGAEFIEPPSIRGDGDWADPDAVLVCRPSDDIYQAARGKGGMTLPTWIPATGDQLSTWIDTHHSTLKELAEFTGLSTRTLRRASGRGALPLTSEVRSALRAALWGGEDS